MEKRNKSVLYVTIILLMNCINMSCVEKNGEFGAYKPPAVDPISTPTPPSQSIDSEKIDRLKAIVPTKPVIIGSAKDVIIMREAAETERPDALNLLIECLAYNYDPANSNESRTQDEMIPAIGIIRQSFGENAGEALYKAGISSDQKWLVDRIALASKIILGDSRREELGRKYLSDRSNSKVEYFADVLSKDVIKIQFAIR